MAHLLATSNPRSPTAGLPPKSDVRGQRRGFEHGFEHGLGRAWHAGPGTTVIAKDDAMAQQGNVTDPSYLRLVDLAWDIRQMARKKDLSGRLSQLIVILDSKPRLWINGAFCVEADPNHESSQERYQVLRQAGAAEIGETQADEGQAGDAQAGDVLETILADADRTAIVDFIISYVAEPGVGSGI
jgi:hypothetical protein